MFGRRSSKAAKAQELAEDAWTALVSTWDSAREHTGDLVGDTGDRVGDVKDEAWRRAAAALDALSGRRPNKPWALIFAAVAAGAALGWAAAAAIGRSPGLAAFDTDTETSDLSAPS
jgi:ferric-dicitrate binding protein FerR (iron transport regulator)